MNTMIEEFKSHREPLTEPETLLAKEGMLAQLRGGLSEREQGYLKNATPEARALSIYLAETIPALHSKFQVTADADGIAFTCDFGRYGIGHLLLAEIRICPQGSLTCTLKNKMSKSSTIKTINTQQPLGDARNEVEDFIYNAIFTEADSIWGKLFFQYVQTPIDILDDIIVQQHRSASLTPDQRKPAMLLEMDRIIEDIRVMDPDRSPAYKNNSPVIAIVRALIDIPTVNQKFMLLQNRHHFSFLDISSPLEDRDFDKPLPILISVLESGNVMLVLNDDTDREFVECSPDSVRGLMGEYFPSGLSGLVAY